MPYETEERMLWPSMSNMESENDEEIVERIKRSREAECARKNAAGLAAGKIGEGLQGLKGYVLLISLRLSRRQIKIAPKEPRMPRRPRPMMEPILWTMNNP